MDANLNQDVPRYLVLAFANHKPVWVERCDADCDAAGTLNDLYAGQIEKPIQVVLFNVGARTCFDVSAEFAEQIAARAVKDQRTLRHDLLEFCEQHLGIAAMNDLREAA